MRTFEQLRRELYRRLRNRGVVPPGGTPPPPGPWDPLANSYGFGPDSTHTGPIRLVTFPFMDSFGGPGPLSQTDVNNQAKYIEVFVARKGGNSNYDTQLTGMRNQRENAAPAKPTLKMLFYDDPGGTETSSGSSTAPDTGDANHPWDLYNYPTSTDPGAGNRNNKAFRTGASGSSNWIMRIWDSRWHTYVNNNYTSQYSPYDGVCPDVIGAFPAQKWHNGAGDTNPYNFDLGSNAAWYTPSRWIDFASSVLADLAVALGPTPYVFGNGVSKGDDYFNASCSRLLDVVGITGMMCEEFCRTSNNKATVYRSLAQWQEDVDMLLDANAKGKVILCCTKLWPQSVAGNPAATQAQSKLWFAYALGTFLLGTDGRHFWHYRHDDIGTTYVAGVEGATVADSATRDDQKGRHHWFADNFYGSGDIWLDRINIGSATQSAVTHVTELQVGSPPVYVRTFTNGIVIVNGDNTSRTYPMTTVSSGKTHFTDVSGATDDGAGHAFTSGVTITVGANRAFVLTGTS